MASKSPSERGKRLSSELRLASSQTSPSAIVEIGETTNDDFQQLIERAPEGITIYQDHHIVFANQAAAEQLCASNPTEIIGRNAFDFIVPADHERVTAHLRRLYEGSIPSEVVRLQRIGLDGRITDVETVAVTTQWRGRQAGLGMTRDITVRVQAETRLQGFLATATQWLWETDAEHRFTFFSDGLDKTPFEAAGVFGKTRWELVGATPDNDKLWHAHVADLEARRAFLDFEYQSKTAPWSGQYRSVSGMPIFDVHGVFIGYRGTSRDITEQKRAEQALKESEQRSKMALEGARGGVFDIDLISGDVTYDEQSALMLGYDRADQVPRQLTDWVERLHPEDREAARIRLDQFLEGKIEVLRSEQRQMTKSGDWLWFDCIGKVVERDDDGRPLRLVGVRFDITKRKQAERTIEHMALHDALTKLPNRFYFVSELERACSAVMRDDTSLAVLFLDLDHFKDINDTFGHSVGDKLLIEVASRLQSCLRGGDLVARFGGDEFVMVVTQPYDPTAISYLADRIIKTIAAPCDIDGLTVHTSISIGVAIYPDDGPDIERILANADLALYTAKRAGRHTWQVFDHRLQDQLQAQRFLDQELRHAFDRQQFELHYQPLIDIADDRISGFEALIRWNHPERGQVLPDAFIPAAEQNRLIIPLTEWVLQEATAQLQRWASIGLGEHKIAVNVSPILLKLQGFVDLIDSCLTTTGCNPRRLVIEITEEALVDEPKIISVLMALRERGVTIAIDDFGTGYSSMARLKSLPIDILKIDRSFLARVTHDASDATVVESLVNVGHGLGKKVVAEGVETAEQLGFLKKVGCDLAQGFFINHPMPAASIPSWFEQWQSSRLCCAKELDLFQPKT